MLRETVEQFWEAIGGADYDAAAGLMHEDALVWLPNTREVFRGRSRYIASLKFAPARWQIRIERLHPTPDGLVVCVVQAKDPEHERHCFITAFFTIREGRISIITEYWSENRPAPAWRREQGFTELY
ncbi:MAG: nuclear transport factor 2 family protein [Bacteroidia bacterium]|nr:nuclear transport factor 2 family protein [Bacteroidia bacterium]